MSLFRRDKEPGTEIVPVEVRVAEREVPPKYDFADMVWRCCCGTTGTSRNSAATHVARSHGRCQPHDIREYVPREVYEDVYEAHYSGGTELAASGVWVVVRLNKSIPEGEIGRYTSSLNAHVVEATTGLEAIQERYEAAVRGVNADDREKHDGRYVAIDFFTGYRAEALITAEWRANVHVAEGSHQ